MDMLVVFVRMLEINDFLTSLPTVKRGEGGRYQLRNSAKNKVKALRFGKAVVLC